MPNPRVDDRVERKGQWWRQVGGKLLVLALFGLSSCRSAEPNAELERIWGILRHGDLIRAHKESIRALHSFPDPASEWHWRFAILDATALNLSGNYKDVLSLLAQPFPASLHDSELALQKSLLEAQAYARLHRFEEAEARVKEVSQSPHTTHGTIACELMKARGMLEMEQGNYADASNSFGAMLGIARQRGDRFLESMALLDMGFAALQQEHFDSAVDWSNEAISSARGIDARLVEEVALGNLGWARYKTGDTERALQLFVDANNRATGLGDIAGEILWLTATGYVYLGENRFDVAARQR